MKTLNFRRTWMLVVALAAIAVPVFAQANHMRADVPFPFQAGDKVMPAGTYDVEIGLAQNRITVRQVNGNEAVALSAGSGTDPIGKGASLVFQRYGSAYFLRQVESGTAAFSMPKSRTEREMAKTVTSVQLAFVPTWSR